MTALARLIACLAAALGAAHADEPPPKPDGALRIATFNVALNRRNPGFLAQELRLGGSDQIDAVAEIIQRVRPDVILLNEIDWDRRGVAVELFRETLRTGRGGAEGIDFPHIIAEPSNTGVQSGFDLDRDGRTGGPADAHGFGFFEGQYAMALFSRLPFDEAGFRSFRLTRWSEMPGALIPPGHFTAEEAAALRLSSKSHWDAQITAPWGARLHLLASHPTPPVFDGPEDANGRRNHDEVRFWVDYVDGEDWITDDQGREGGLREGRAFVVLGDLNIDPEDGVGRPEALRELMQRAPDPLPLSRGGVEAGTGGPNDRHRGAPGLDTADWREVKGPGNLRVDYVLPSATLRVVGAGVFWPGQDDPLRRLVGEGEKIVSSDHRLVWVDLAPPEE